MPDTLQETQSRGALPSLSASSPPDSSIVVSLVCTGRFLDAVTLLMGVARFTVGFLPEVRVRVLGILMVGARLEVLRESQDC